MLTALGRRLSKNEVVRLLHLVEATTRIDGHALLRAYAIAEVVFSRKERSTIHSVTVGTERHPFVPDLRELDAGCFITHESKRLIAWRADL